MSNNTVKEYIEKAKSIPPAIYNFAALNIVMFIGFVIKDLTVLYMVGTLVLITLLVAALGKVSQMWESPDELISQNVQDRFKEIQNDFHNFVKLLDVKELESSSVNTIITVLFLIPRFFSLSTPAHFLMAPSRSSSVFFCLFSRRFPVLLGISPYGN